MKDVIIIGAGPAGLAAAHRLTSHGVRTIVLEAHPSLVGGLSRTEKYNGILFDLGGHRLFTKSDEVRDFWRESLGKDLSVRDRYSSILYNGMEFSYPLDLTDVFTKFGLLSSFKALFSALKAKCLPRKPIHSFEDWIVNQFGEYLYEIFFRTYTEKVWGLAGSEISADWAAQRVKGVSIVSILKSFFLHAKSNEKGVKSFIGQFEYPRHGIGNLWENVASLCKKQGAQIHLGHKVRAIYKNKDGSFRVTVQTESEQKELLADAIINTSPLSELVGILNPPPPAAVQKLSKTLRYRDMVIVLLVFDAHVPARREQWFYVHTPKLKVGRIQNLKAWSPDLVPEGKDAFVLEYFCKEGDTFWARSDKEILDQAKEEWLKTEIKSGTMPIDGTVIRVPRAYPIYDAEYREAVGAIRGFLSTFEWRLQTAGRNGMHRYNNQDHAVMTGFLAAENLLRKTTHFDLWLVNQDAEYLEVQSDAVLGSKERLSPSTY